MKKHSNFLLSFTAIFLLNMFSISAFPQEPEKNKPVVVLSGDPLGFLTFGPSVNVEAALVDNISVTASFRAAHLGLITKELFNDYESSQIFGFSARMYVNPSQRFKGFFLGPRVEFGSVTKSENVYIFLGTGKREAKYDILGYGAEVGYHWMFDNGFNIELSDLIGVISSKRNDEFHKSDKWNVDAYVLYMLSLKFGIAF